jgi:hypothetical protein
LIRLELPAVLKFTFKLNELENLCVKINAFIYVGVILIGGNIDIG